MIQPIGDRVVIEPIDKAEQMINGIVLPDSAKEKPQEGKVIAVGSGQLHHGQRVPMEVKPGETVLYAKYSGTEVKVEGKELLVLRESDILAIISQVNE